MTTRPQHSGLLRFGYSHYREAMRRKQGASGCRCRNFAEEEGRERSRVPSHSFGWNTKKRTEPDDPVLRLSYLSATITS